jgi:hypothetical protein
MDDQNVEKIQRTDENSDKILNIQESVFRLLKYSISQANIKIDDNFIDAIVIVLHKEPKDLTIDDEALLWKGYSTLSSLVYPATDESIMLSEQIDQNQRSILENGSSSKNNPIARLCNIHNIKSNASLVLLLVIFFIIQTYTTLLSGTLRNIDIYNSDLNFLIEEKEKASKMIPVDQLASFDFPNRTWEANKFTNQLDTNY